MAAPVRDYNLGTPAWMMPENDHLRPCMGHTMKYFMMEEDEPKPDKLFREHFTEQAIELCNQCPFVELCLEVAVNHPWVCGVWGGTTHGQRRCRSGLCGHPGHDRVAS